jgi:hypothetical protein
MRILAILLSIFLLTVSCTSQTRYVDTSAGKIINPTHPVKSVLDVYSLYLENNEIHPMGSGYTENKRGAIVSFYQVGVVREELKMDEARALIVESVKELVSRINEDKKLRRRLAYRKITPNKVHFSLIVTDTKGTHVADGKHVARISLRDGLVKYYKYDPDALIAQQKYEPTKLKSRFYSDRSAGKKRTDNLVLLDQELFTKAVSIHEKPEISLWDKKEEKISPKSESVERVERNLPVSVEKQESNKTSSRDKMSEEEVQSTPLSKKSPEGQVTNISLPELVQEPEIGDEKENSVEVSVLEDEDFVVSENGEEFDLDDFLLKTDFLSDDEILSELEKSLDIERPSISE